MDALFFLSFRNELEWKKAAQNQSACPLQEEVSPPHLPSTLGTAPFFAKKHHFFRPLMTEVTATDQGLKWPAHFVWKLLKMSHLNFGVLPFPTNFCPIKTDMSGNTVWPQASGFQNLAKMDNFCPLKM